ncbi:MAG TPA: hypothetical protein VL463_18850 [Kofleriaceae bacterium]|nr:hypothetical protein [Kofleriaceae bacterium]
MRSFVVVVLGLAACQFDKSGVGAGGIDAPIGSADANVDAMVDASQVGCKCSGNTLSGCQGQPDMVCDLGCSTTGGAHCKQIVPSNGVPLTDLNGVTAALETTSAGQINSRHEYTIDTDTGEILDYGVDGFPTNPTPTTIRAAGTGVLSGMEFDTAGAVNVLGVDSLHIASDSTLYGFGTHPLAILSRGDVLIEGDIDFSAGCYDQQGDFNYSCAGPGGGVGGTQAGGATGCGPGANGVAGHATGGGGGGMSTKGGNGGDYSNGNKGGAGGSMASCPGPTLEPLAGGGGGGVAAAGAGGDGGGGGGGLQITSLTSITVTHPVNASNTSEIYVGGQGGRGTPTTNGGGGGGGAGGAILLEAITVTVSSGGVLAANGGGGGGGRITGTTADGGGGTSTTSQALGGAGDGVGGNTGRGGLGGSALGMASPGSGPQNQDGTGGGGGAAGRVRLNAKPAGVDTTTGIVSPVASVGQIPVQ